MHSVHSSSIQTDVAFRFAIIDAYWYQNEARLSDFESFHYSESSFSGNRDADVGSVFYSCKFYEQFVSFTSNPGNEFILALFSVMSYEKENEHVFESRIKERIGMKFKSTPWWIDNINKIKSNQKKMKMIKKELKQ
jgi:hypothetical protein